MIALLHIFEGFISPNSKGIGSFVKALLLNIIIVFQSEVSTLKSNTSISQIHFFLHPEKCTLIATFTAMPFYLCLQMKSTKLHLASCQEVKIKSLYA